MLVRRDILPLLREAGPGAPAQPLKLALIGPHLNSTTALLSGRGYSGENRLVQTNTILAAFAQRASQLGARFAIVGVAAGCEISSGCSHADLAGVQAAVADADVVVAFVGLYPTGGGGRYAGAPCSESEAFDRIDIKLCGRQQDILQAVLQAGKKLVTVLINGGTIDLTWVKQHSPAILEGWYPGQEGGEAVAAVVLGDRSPTGRLPVTLYDSSITEQRNITDMALRSHDGLTYLHYRGNVLWPFGFGLAYTSWKLAIASGSGSASRLMATTAGIAAAYKRYYSIDGLHSSPFATLTLDVSNVGQRTSDVVVQIFAVNTASAGAGALPNPLRQLAGFERAAAVSTTEGGRQIEVGLLPLAFTQVDETGSVWVEPTTWRILATVDGTTMVGAELVASGPRAQVLAWPRLSPE